MGKYSYAQFDDWKKMPLADKILWSEQVILLAVKNSKVHSVSLSWGKDSVVMLYLIRKFCKSSKVIFANTFCEYPETYKYRDEMLKGFFKGIEYYETKPIKTFWQCVDEYGYPTMRKLSEQRGSKEEHASPKCCTFLKERPMERKEKELGIDTVFIGLQASESMNRRLVFLRCGEYYFRKQQKRWAVLPLAIWTDEDIWAYVKKEKIPMNEIYKTHPRNGCMFCTGFKSWKAQMAKYNPAIYKKILKEKEGQTTIECFAGR